MKIDWNRFDKMESISLLNCFETILSDLNFAEENNKDVKEILIKRLKEKELLISE